MGIFGLRNEDIEAFGEADPVSKFQAYQVAEQGLRRGEQTERLTGQAIQSGDLAFKQEQRKAAMKKRLLPLDSLGEGNPYATDAFGRPMPNFTKSQVSIAEKAFAHMIDPETGQPMLQEINGQKFVPQDAIEAYMSELESQFVTKGKLAEYNTKARMNDMTERYQISRDKIRSIIEKNPDATPETDKALALAMKEEKMAMDDLNNSVRISKGMLDESKQVRTITKADIDADPRIPAWAVGKTPEEFKQMQEGLGGGKTVTPQVKSEWLPDGKGSYQLFNVNELDNTATPVLMDGKPVVKTVAQVRELQGKEDPNQEKPPKPLSEKDKIKLKHAKIKDKSSLDSVDLSIDTLDKAIIKLIKEPGVSSIFGPMDARTPNLRSTATNAQTVLDSIVGQLGVRALNDMRAANQTGGAVGQVTEKEWPILQSQLGSLSQMQDWAHAKATLEDIQTTLIRIRSNAQSKYTEMWEDQDIIETPSGKDKSKAGTTLTPEQEAEQFLKGM